MSHIHELIKRFESQSTPSDSVSLPFPVTLDKEPVAPPGHDGTGHRDPPPVVSIYRTAWSPFQCPPYGSDATLDAAMRGSTWDATTVHATPEPHPSRTGGLRWELPGPYRRRKWMVLAVASALALAATPNVLERVQSLHILPEGSALPSVVPSSIAASLPETVPAQAQSMAVPATQPPAAAAAVQSVATPEASAPRPLPELLLARADTGQSRSTEFVQVTSSAPAPEASTHGKPFAIQVGSFVQRDVAEQHVSILRARGYDPFIQEFTITRQGTPHTISTIRIGYFATTDAARQFADEFRKDMPDLTPLVVASGAANVINHDVRQDTRTPSTQPTTSEPAAIPAVSMTRRAGGDVAASTRPLPVLYPPKEPVIRPSGGKAGREKTPATLSALLTEAEKAQKRGDNGSAETMARRAVAMQPDNMDARYLLGEILFKTGRGSEAYPVLQDGMAIGLHPGIAKLLARIMLQEEQTESAIGILETLKSRLPVDDEETAALLAVAYQRTGQHIKAVDTYEHLIRKYGEKGVWSMGLGISMEHLKESASAVQAYQSAMDSGQLSMELRQFVARKIRLLSN
jgi:cell division septation protein DedD/Tfp pilus assembly protein PilF